MERQSEDRTNLVQTFVDKRVEAEERVRNLLTHTNKAVQEIKQLPLDSSEQIFLVRILNDLLQLSISFPRMTERMIKAGKYNN